MNKSKQCIAAVVDFVKLGPNWDGHDAQPMDVRSIGPAVQFFNQYPEELPLPQVIPCHNGNIAIEFSKPSASLEIEFGIDGTALYRREFEGEVVTGECAVTNHDSFLNLINWYQHPTPLKEVKKRSFLRKLFFGRGK